MDKTLGLYFEQWRQINKHIKSHSSIFYKTLELGMDEYIRKITNFELGLQKTMLLIHITNDLHTL